MTADMSIGGVCLRDVPLQAYYEAPVKVFYTDSR